MRDDLVEIKVTAHLYDVPDGVRGDINVPQSPVDGYCALAILVEPSSCLLQTLEMHTRRVGKLTKKTPMQLKE